MVRLYGDAPYEIVLLHGGPGAGGSLRGFARQLQQRSRRGVLEAIQSKYSVKELMEEMYGQLTENCPGRVSLIGHSWGAWLAVLFAEKYPERVRQAILVGCGPLADSYVPQIGARRLQTLSGAAAAAFQRLLDGQATGADMENMPVILAKADNCCLQDPESHRADQTDSSMYHAVWPEAAKLRTEGRLLTAFQKLQSPLYLIQGADDPHPAEGVTVPLRENGVLCETCILEKCGHSPFMEKYAQEAFYRYLLKILA